MFSSQRRESARPAEGTLKKQPAAKGAERESTINPLWHQLATGTMAAAIRPESPALTFVQAKLTIGSQDDMYEREADLIASEVMRMPAPGLPPIQRKCASCEDQLRRQPASLDKVMRMADLGPLGSAPVAIQRKCAECEDEGEKWVHTKRAASANGEKAMDTGAARRAAERGGAPLSRELRSYFEPRFGQDFSRVRVHSDGEAAAGARAVQARAYTTGRNIVFGSGQYSPETEGGRWLLAHELAHVVQQGGQTRQGSIQRCADAATDTQYDTKATAVKAHAEYGKLAAGPKATTDKIIADAKPKNNCIYYIDKLKLLFDTPRASAASTTMKFQAATATASAVETKRMKTDPAKDRKNIEEGAAKNAVFTKRPGKFGGGNYEVDARDPRNIVVRATIFLTKKGTGTDADVNAIKGMEDAIEKAASTKGYVVDIDFVTTADADTFKVDVDPSQWEVATNWSGGDPTGFAHELHHMFAFPLDRYDYIESQAGNEHMEIPDRLHWFGEEMTKPAGYNNPASIMSGGPHPLDDDACNVAGLNVATCVATREKVNKMYKEITAAYTSYDERILHCISKHLKSDPDTMMAVLRELFRQLVGSKKDRERILKRAKDGTDAFGKVFQQIPSAQQTELLAIITI